MIIIATFAAIIDEIRCHCRFTPLRFRHITPPHTADITRFASMPRADGRHIAPPPAAAPALMPLLAIIRYIAGYLRRCRCHCAILLRRYAYAYIRHCH